MKKADSDIIVIIGSAEEGEKKVSYLKSTYSIADFDCKTLYAEEENIVPMVFSEVDYIPLFSGRRLLHVKNCQNLTKSDCESLEPLFEKKLDNICAVFTGSDIKQPLKKYVKESQKEAARGLFPEVFRLKRKDDRKRLVALCMEELAANENNFVSVIAAAEIYLKNLLLSQRFADAEITKKFKIMHRLDFELKTGRFRKGPQLEIFLNYIFS